MTAVDPTRTKRDRDEVFVEYTKSVCPVCKVVVDAQVNIRDGRVFLRKRRAEHGWFEALVYGDARMYLESARFNKPGTIPLAFQTEVRDGCPSDCGLCPEHEQHACLGIIEVNTNCNLDCPICFADSGHQPVWPDHGSYASGRGGPPRRRRRSHREPPLGGPSVRRSRAARVGKRRALARLWVILSRCAGSHIERDRLDAADR
ncbi:MAG: hypothetical protein ACRDP6_44550 [Actinoallomurus sp.]